MGLILASIVPAMAFSGGDGSSGNPWQVANINDLQEIHTDTAYYNDYFEQTSHINASETSTWNGGDGFIPIGNNSNRFTGNYDGNGYSITDIYINETASVQYNSIFGYTENAIIHDVALVDPFVYGFSYTATIASFVHGSSSNIYNISVDGGNVVNYISGVNYPSYAGTIIGFFNNGNLHDVWSSADLTTYGENPHGGIVGDNANGIINKTYYNGNINVVAGSSTYVGEITGGYYWGLAGTNVYNSYFNNEKNVIDNGIGNELTDAQMQIQSSFVGFDFSNIWIMDTYPVLRYYYYTYNPEITYPVNGTELNSTYPSLTDISFVWTDNIVASSSSYQLSRDSNYNTLVSSGTTTNNYKTLSLDADDYYFRVRYLYDTGVYSDWTESQFSINTTVTDYGTAIQGVVYESSDGSYSALSNAKVTIYNDSWSDDYLTGSNGYYLFEDLGISDYYLTASKDGYETSSINIVNVTSAMTYTKDIYLEEENAPTYITPHYVTFIVKSVTLKYSDVEVNVYIGDSATVYKSGTTGSSGTITFELDEDVEYRITFYKEDVIDRTVSDTFSGTSYTVWVDADELISSLWDTSDQEISNIDIDVTTTNINDSAAYITVNYTDSMSETSGLVISLLQPISGQTGNYTTLDTYNAGSISSVSHSFIVTDYDGESYVVSVTGTHSTHGEIDKLYGVTFPATETEYGIGTQLLAWIAIAFIIWIGSTASQADVYPTGIVVCGIAGFFKIIGVTGEIISWGSIILAIMICIAGILYKSEQESA